MDDSPKIVLPIIYCSKCPKITKPYWIRLNKFLKLPFYYLEWALDLNLAVKSWCIKYCYYEALIGLLVWNTNIIVSPSKPIFYRILTTNIFTQHSLAASLPALWLACIVRAWKVRVRGTSWLWAFFINIFKISMIY